MASDNWCLGASLRGNMLFLITSICNFRQFVRRNLTAQYAIAIAPYAFFEFINLQFLTVRLGQYAGAIALRRNTLALLRPMFNIRKAGINYWNDLINPEFVQPA
ncbi:MAG: hypothetical protein PHW13_10255 [Methylococcales bacterium]|nr:hypothetical protein [Methylococcales bacterium]